MAQSENPEPDCHGYHDAQVDGWRCCQAMRVDNNTKHILYCFLTAVTSNMPPEDEDQGINVDGQYYPAMAKPI